MTKNFTALRIAAACLALVAAPANAAGNAACGTIGTKSRLVCDEGACIRVSFKDLCEAVQASYPVKRRVVKPSRIELVPVREQLTLLIAQAS